MPKGQIRQFQCKHEDGCSKPGKYWRMRNYAEMLNEHGEVIERVMPEDKIEPGDRFSCTECGQEAWLKWVDERELRKGTAEPAKQGAFL